MEGALKVEGKMPRPTFYPVSTCECSEGEVGGLGLVEALPERAVFQQGLREWGPRGRE